MHIDWLGLLLIAAGVALIAVGAWEVLGWFFS